MKLTKKQLNVTARCLPKARTEKISPMKFINALLHDELQLDLDVSDSTCVKVHPDGTGARKKTDHNPSAKLEAEKTPKSAQSPPMP